METKTPSARYSTKEVAARLYMTEQRTRHLLFAAGVPHTKAGNSYLWDAECVERLIIALGKGGTP
ncbi:MAG TPA: hypothetical protein VEK08_08210 [Planctomycetota bacterium]|nr:hypothetical protein [Planctomycetota bacterium]